jgi:hypothetical protein
VGDWGPYASWVAVALSAMALAYTIIANRRKDSDAKLAAIDVKLESKASKSVVDVLVGKVDKIEDRITIIDSDLKHLPDKDVTHRLELAIASMRTEVRELAATVKPIGATMGRVQEVLLERMAEK